MRQNHSNSTQQTGASRDTLAPTTKQEEPNLKAGGLDVHTQREHIMRGPEAGSHRHQHGGSSPIRHEQIRTITIVVPISFGGPHSTASPVTAGPLSPVTTIPVGQGSDIKGSTPSSSGPTTRIPFKETSLVAPDQQERPLLGEPSTRTEPPKEKIEKIIQVIQEATTEKRASASPGEPQPEPSKERTVEAQNQTRETASPTNRQDDKVTSPIVNQAILNLLNDPRMELSGNIQQVINSELARAQTPQRNPSSAETTGMTQSVPEARESIIDKLSQLRDALQTVVDRSSPRPTLDRDNHAISANALTPVALQEPNLRPVSGPTLVEMAPLGSEGQTASRTSLNIAQAEPLPASRVTTQNGSLITEPRLLSGGGELHDSSTLSKAARLEQAGTFLDGVEKVLTKLVSLETLQKIDRALETAAISVAAAATLGVLGAEVALREITVLGRELLRRLRESGLIKMVAEPEQLSPEELIEHLEAVLHDRGVETIEKPANMTADIVGVITLQDGSQVEGISIDGGSLGTTSTDLDGRFRFANVPLESGYALELTDPRYSFSPSRVVGTVSAINYITITAHRL